MSKFGHFVFFTLRDNSDQAQQQLIDACHQHLSGHPGTVHFSVGRLADKQRDVNDRNFHVSLHLVFETEADHDAYQVADRHDTFIAENKDNWTKVRVFDSYIE